MGGCYSVAPEHGPRIAAIGGGTGLSTLLRGLKLYTKNLTAIVTMADDGGGSGRLRQDLGMLPPGDIRSCLEALANAEPLMAQLMHYRFCEGTLAGQSFGNLFLAALNGIMPSFDRAVESMSQVLAITGRVLPVTTADVQLEATFENGASVVGESRIFRCKKEQDCRIRRVRLIPEHPRALPAAVEALEEAEVIVLAPGSLYTSIIPNLLVDGIVDAIRRSRALKVYVCNVMTQDGETEGYTVSDHIRALFKHSCPGLFDLCLTNSSPIPPAVVQRYAQEGAEPIFCDRESVEALGVEIVSRPVSTVETAWCAITPATWPGSWYSCTTSGISAWSPPVPTVPPTTKWKIKGDSAMQSFAYKVKSELCRQPVSRQCCARAEAYGVLLFCNTFSSAEVRIITENPEFAGRLPRLFQRAFSLKFDSLPDGTRDKLIFRITRQEKLRRIVDLLGYDPSLVLHVNFGLLEDECCRTAFMRGAFLAGGSVTDPEKRYHLELATSHMQASREVSALLTEMGFVPHSVRRSGSSVIYFKQSEHIEDLLTTIGAPAAAMDIMTAKVDKEIRNGANRAMNCDMANVNKTVDAALEQTAAISRLAESGRLALLPEKLRQAAQLRLDNPEMSLQQLAERSDPPVSKSCMNHRMRRLMEEARESHE